MTPSDAARIEQFITRWQNSSGNERANYQFIKSRELQQEQLEISLLSEPSLAEDWLTPEEDEAWQHL